MTGPVSADHLLFSLTDAVNRSAKAGLVLSVFYWLGCSALPPVDGRRAAEGSRVTANPRIGPDTANLYFGDAEHELAGKIRRFIRSIELCRVRSKSSPNANAPGYCSGGQDSGTSTEQAFNAWLSSGRVLQTLVEPTALGGTSSMPVPHTLDDWRKCRLRIESAPYDAAFANTQSAKLMLGGGGPKATFKRRNYAS